MRVETLDSALALIGHPYAPIGMGEHVRCTFRAMRSVGVNPALVDIYGMNIPEADLLAEFSVQQAQKTREINIYHINGDEVDQALATLADRSGAQQSYDIVYPAWELARYPLEWAQHLNRFDEVWAPSRFIEKSLAAAVDSPVYHMPLACEVILSGFRGRRWFGIPESSYAFLFFFDVRSYATRKNPEGVVSAFRRMLELRPLAETVLVLKVNGAELAPDALTCLRRSLADIAERVVLIDATLTDNETKNLVRCCDCFVSLHRSEGFGRGLIEAMYLGKPVIGTAYSGNMDFMDSDNSLPVSYRMQPLVAGDYPHWEGQAWADPDLEQAATWMAALIDDPRQGYAIGRRAADSVRRNFSYRASGRRYLERLCSIMRRLGESG